jgi:hypothetical protein
MIAGAIRYACMIMAALALLNAPYYSPQEIASRKAYENDVYGNSFFPGIPGIQQNVFQESLIGSLIKQRAGVLLIASTKTENVALKRRKDDLP